MNDTHKYYWGSFPNQPAEASHAPALDWVEILRQMYGAGLLHSEGQIPVAPEALPSNGTPSDSPSEIEQWIGPTNNALYQPRLQGGNAFATRRPA